MTETLQVKYGLKYLSGVNKGEVFEIAATQEDRAIGYVQQQADALGFEAAAVSSTDGGNTWQTI
ncbi:hypothetical protein FHU41_000770 [Psychromicrobium silvestre]|uniref:Uncharacterized protein n=1 Tax=Psychromicrobium silvestre TaxID=1645614 RepID=A0A7Y9S4S1_9MICC|nr:hypothetical protein [Psychromicrobium silvestre]NYE94549.1 hypothetical protein [Psychromicrobium silvestre]